MPPKRRSKAATKIAYSESDSEYDDEIQIYHKQKDKILLDSDHGHGDSDETEEEEVYRLEESESEDDEEIVEMQQQLRQIKRNQVKRKLGSDLEDDSASDHEALPDSRAWGSKKSWFMGGDVRDNKIILSGEEDEAGDAAMEEAEMEKIEKRQMERMTEDDYLPPSMMMKLKKMEEKKDKKQKTTKSTEAKGKKKKTSGQKAVEALETIKVSTKAPKRTEFERLKELHPEYAPLVNDFVVKLRELEQVIVPLMGLVKKGKITGSGATYLKMKYHIVNNYLICGGFYVYLMAKKTQGIHQHPVMKRLVELQQFYNRLVPLDKRVKGDLDRLLKLLWQGKDVGQVVCTGAQDQGEEEEGVQTSAKTSRKQKSTQELGAPSAKRRKVKAGQDSESNDDENDEDGEQQDELEYDDDNGDDQGRRAITHAMEKNKGLTAHRKKELKNPRVKHRKKYRRALIRRKGQVRDVRPAKTIYHGEMTGIRAGIVRSRKLN